MSLVPTPGCGQLPQSMCWKDQSCCRHEPPSTGCWALEGSSPEQPSLPGRSDLPASPGAAVVQVVFVESSGSLPCGTQSWFLGGTGWEGFAGEAELCPCVLVAGLRGLQLPPSCGVWEMSWTCQPGRAPVAAGPGAESSVASSPAHMLFRTPLATRGSRITECSGLEGTSGSSSPTPLPKQGCLQQAAQDLVQVGLEYLQRRRLRNLPGQPVPRLCHPQREEVLPHVQTELPLLQFVPIAPCPVAGHH